MGSHRIMNLTFHGFRHHGTQTIINGIIASRDGEDDIKDPEIREMIDDLKNMHAAQGGKTIENIESTEHKHDKDLPADEALEGIFVRLQEKNQEGDDDEVPKGIDEVTEEENARWKEYRHHQFVKRWGLLADSGTKDEEWWIPNPPVLEKDDPQYLCEMCRHVNFDVLFKTRGLPGNQIPGPSEIAVYAIEKLLRDDELNCAFCRLLRRKLDSDNLLSSKDPARFGSRPIRFQVLDEGPGYALRLDVAFEDDDMAPVVPRFVIQKVDVECQLPLLGQEVLERAALDQLKSWLHICEETHPPAVIQPLKPNMLELRVIDVEKGCVVELEYPIRYTCLSYVWGGAIQTLYTAETKERYEKPGGLFQPELKLPQTISDAMEVTRAIGLRYLWVDALCILQDNVEHKARNIADMGAIYSNATLCIVASTNTSPADGLPGVVLPRKTKQVIETVQGLRLAAAFHDPRKRLADVDSSTWDSRGWTYQEQQLPGRSVYFTESEMCLICPHLTFFEDTRPVLDLGYKPPAITDKTSLFANPHQLWMRIWGDPTQSNYINKAFQTDDGVVSIRGEDPNNPGEASTESAPIYDLRPVTNTNPTGSVKFSGNDTWDIYSKAVYSYTQRNLTWDSDAVNAFRGTEELIRQGSNTKFWYGMPEFAFDHALLWHPLEPLRRREQDGKTLFPSWSWAAWKGHSHYRGRGWHNSIYHGPVSVVNWLERLSLEDWIEFCKTQGLSGENLEQTKQDAAKSTHLLRAVDPHAIYKLAATDKLGWTAQMDKSKNKHYYTHDFYPGINFSYPICLPNQRIVELPDADGTLYFKAHSVPVQFCDMNATPFVQEPRQQSFIQIGLGDEERSVNFRPSWKRILYHKGYRAGFLTLHAPLEDMDLSSPEQYILVAVSRDARPRIAPPVEGWEIYRQIDPVRLQDDIWFRYKWGCGEAAAAAAREAIPPPNDVAPDGAKENENGDARWDQGRYDQRGFLIYELYNVLLLKDMGDGKSFERVGVGKIHYHAFHHASPTDRVVMLK
jgi:hypothetical protein